MGNYVSVHKAGRRRLHGNAGSERRLHGKVDQSRFADEGGDISANQSKASDDQNKAAAREKFPEIAPRRRPAQGVAKKSDGDPDRERARRRRGGQHGPIPRQ